ncbi:MAG: response regulator [Acidobacteria bacterium]|nr:response regulator [Acidobacteriota bacterium]
MHQIVLIDDDPMATKPLAKALLGRGYHVTLFDNGKTALEYIKHEKPALVVCDMLLPGLHGLDLLRQIKTAPTMKETKVIMITAVYKSHRYRSEAQEMGADAFFLKPIGLENFVQTVVEMIGEVDTEKISSDSIISELQEEFEAYLQNALAELQESLRQVGKPVKKKLALENLCYYAHSLAGSAGNFHYNAVTQHARILDHYVQELQEGGRELEVDHLTALVKKVVEVAAERDPISDPETEAGEPDVEPVRSSNRVIFWSTNRNLGERFAEIVAPFHWVFVPCFDHQELQDALDQGAEYWVIDLPDNPIECKKIFAHIRKLDHYTVPRLFLARDPSFDTALESIRHKSIAMLAKPLSAQAITDFFDREAAWHREPGKVLIIDDDPRLASHYSRVLAEAGLFPSYLTQPEQAMDFLADFQPDLILIDWYMPEISGLELARILRQSKSYLGIPIVFLTVEQNPEQQLHALDEGVDAFLNKPITDAALVRHVKGRIRRFREIRSGIVNDGLTGILNHAAGLDRVRSEISRAQRNKSAFSLALIDLDHFKQVNDTHGHLIGDKVIKSLCHSLRNRLRRSDILARYGGEEFLIGLPETDGETALHVLDRIREEFSQIMQFSEDQIFQASFSGGIASWHADLDDAQLINQADRALYQAKQAGRNCFRNFAPSEGGASD